MHWARRKIALKRKQPRVDWGSIQQIVQRAFGETALLRKTYDGGHYLVLRVPTALRRDPRPAYGIWKAIREHLPTCEFAVHVAGRSGGEFRGVVIHEVGYRVSQHWSGDLDWVLVYPD